MPRFFVDSVEGDSFTICGDDARHISRSLRMTPGERLVLCDGRKNECECEIVSTGDTVSLKALCHKPSESEPSLRLTLYQGCPKGEKLELITEKAVELGVSRLVPVITSRSISRPDAGKAEKKAGRLSRHALEAAKQCGRGVVPEVEGAVSFDELIRRIPSHGLALMCYEGGGEPLRSIGFDGIEDIAVVIGPEGGFSPEEAEKCLAAGARLISLGKRILRTETAAIAAVTAVMTLSGELE